MRASIALYFERRKDRKKKVVGEEALESAVMHKQQTIPIDIV